jgi:hypothetical protein
MRSRLIAFALGLCLASPVAADDRNGDGLADHLGGSGEITPRPGAPIAVVDTGDQAVGYYVSRLSGLGHTVTTIPMDSGIGTLALYQIVILPVGHAQASNYHTFNGLAPHYLQYTMQGGALWVGQPNPYQMPGNQATITWVPYALTLGNWYDGNDCPPVVVDDTHCITQNAGSTVFSFPADTILDLGPEWQVLVRGPATNNPGVLVATHNTGRILVELCHPSPTAGCPVSDAALDRYVMCLLQPPISVNPSTWAQTKAAYR